MRTRLLSLACLIVLTGWSQARLGETLEECSERYGPLIERRHAEFPQSDPEVAVFSKSSVTIFVEFKDGKAWHIKFRKPLLTAVEMESLLKANSSDEMWSPALSSLGRTYRQSTDHTRLSVATEPRGGMPATLDVMTREYVDQYRANYVAKVRNPEALEEMKRKVNPLPGF